MLMSLHSYCNNCALMLHPCWPVLKFSKIKLEKSISMNWLFSLQRLFSKLIFAGYTGSKNQVRNRVGGKKPFDLHIPGQISSLHLTYCSAFFQAIMSFSVVVVQYLVPCAIVTVCYLSICRLPNPPPMASNCSRRRQGLYNLEHTSYYKIFDSKSPLKK